MLKCLYVPGKQLTSRKIRTQDQTPGIKLINTICVIHLGLQLSFTLMYDSCTIQLLRCSCNIRRMQSEIASSGFQIVSTGYNTVIASLNIFVNKQLSFEIGLHHWLVILFARDFSKILPKTLHSKLESFFQPKPDKFKRNVELDGSLFAFLCNVTKFCSYPRRFIYLLGAGEGYHYAPSG